MSIDSSACGGRGGSGIVCVGLDCERSSAWDGLLLIVKGPNASLNMAAEVKGVVTGRVVQFSVMKCCG